MCSISVLLVVALVSLNISSSAAHYGHSYYGGFGSARYRGFECVLPSGESGVCQDIYSCPQIFKRIWKYHEEPVHCGFVAYVPTVCCPSPRITPKVPSQRPLTRDAGGAANLLPPESQINFECGISQPLEKSTVFHRFKRHVVGGHETPVGRYPWMAIVGYIKGNNVKWICDGVLIHPEWVLSAAHCVLESNSYVVRLGEHNLNSTSDGAYPIDYRVSNITFHPDFHVEVGYHDLVLLKLSLPVHVQRFIMPVCLPWTDNSNLIGRKAKLAGWGAEVFGGPLSNVLRDAVLTIFDTKVCDKSYSNLTNYNTLWPKGITDEFIICAGSPDGGIDSCQGDSGGPLVVRREGFYTLIGIVSKGFGCGIADFPGIYVSVKAYLKWIKEQSFSEMDMKGFD